MITVYVELSVTLETIQGLLHNIGNRFGEEKQLSKLN